MSLWFLIGVGGFFGAILRYLLSGWIQGNLSTFPLGTLGVNFIGSFFLSLILYLSELKGYFSEETRVALTIGLIGSFTTMSTFSFESFRLMEQKEWGLFGLNISGTIVLTFLAVYLGKILVANIWWD